MFKRIFYKSLLIFLFKIVIFFVIFNNIIDKIQEIQARVLCIIAYNYFRLFINYF